MGARGPKKSNVAAILLKMPAELDEAVRRAAEREGVTLAEWWRRAGAERVFRQASAQKMMPPRAVGGSVADGPPEAAKGRGASGA